MSQTPPVPRPLLRLEAWVNPVLFKDLLAIAVGPSSSAARMILYALLFALPLLGFACAVTFSPGPWRFAGRPVLLALCALLAFFHVSVAVPAATAFALERDRNTLESLIISPLSPWRIVLGKLLTAVSVGALGKAAVLPALAIAVLLGGESPGFIPRYLLLLLAVDTSLAAFALHLGARRREVNTKVTWIKAQTSQTQLVMQATVAISVLTSLVPVYALLILIPVALQSGIHLTGLLDDLAPLGALHPLAALVLWGEADILGLRLPVWLLGVSLHLLFALPFLADAAEAQKTEGSDPGRLPRLLTLPALAFLLLLAASVAVRLGDLGRALVGLISCAVILLGLAAGSSTSKDPTVQVTPRRLLESLLPPRALESRPERSPGFVLLALLLAAPFLLWSCGWTSPGTMTLVGLGVAALSLSLCGVRMTRRAQEKHDEAFLAAVARRNKAGHDAREEPRSDEDEKPAGPRRPLLYLVSGSTLLTVIPLIGIALAKSGTLPALEPVVPFLFALVTTGIALNPLAGLVPAVVAPEVIGTAAAQQWLTAYGLDPQLLFALHVAIYVALGVVSVATLGRPVDLEKALAESEPEPESEAGEDPATARVGEGLAPSLPSESEPEPLPQEDPDAPEPLPREEREASEPESP